MDIKERIERFYNAELSLQEEQELYRYLCENDVPEELQSDKDVVLAMLCDYTDYSLPDGAEERLVAMIEALDKQQEISDRQVSHTDGAAKKIFKIPISWRVSVAVAASLLIAFVLVNRKEQTMHSLGLIAQHKMVPPLNDGEQDTFDSPEEAMEHVKKSLGNTLIAIAKVNDKIDEIENSFSRTIRIHNKK